MSSPQDDTFDVEFYRAFYGDIGLLGHEAAANHWLEFGFKEGRHPNQHRYLASDTSLTSRLPADFSVTIYKYLNTDLVDRYRQDWEFIRHFVELGRAEGRRYKVEHDAFVEELYPRRDGGVARAATQGRYIYASIDDLLTRNGFVSKAFVARFRAEEYVLQLAGHDISNAIQALRHFVEQGWKVLHHIALDHAFDPAFYRRESRVAIDDDAECYRHWLNVGVPAGRQPNARQFQRDLGLRRVAADVSDVLDHQAYIALNPPLAAGGMTPWGALHHLIHHGVLEDRAGKPDAALSADVYLAAADRLSRENQPADAARLYETVLCADSGNAVANQHYGDCLMKQGRHFQAAFTYERAVALGQANVWTYLNLASCYTSLGALDRATETLTRARGLVPGDVAIETRAQAALTSQFQAITQDVGPLVEADASSAATARHARAAALLTQDVRDVATIPAAYRPIRTVAIVADMTLPQCRFYRVQQKSEHLRKAGFAVEIFDKATGLRAFGDGLPYFDAAIFYRVPAFPDIMLAIKQARHAGIPTFYEIDDLIFDDAHYPDSFESYGGQITRQEYGGLVSGTALFRAALAACDHALASTPALAAVMEPLVISRRAFVHRNALSEAHLKVMRGDRPMSDGQVRLFYGTGTKAHNQDFEDQLAPALRRLFTAYPGRFQLVIIGYLRLPAVLRAFDAQISILAPIWDLDAYWGALAQMDVNLAVLRPCLVSDCKSEIKWLEAAMLGIPSVVSRTATYDDVIDEGVTGFLAATEAEWFTALETLVTDAGTRRAVGHAARDVALQRYGIVASAANIAGILNGIAPAVARRRVLIVNVYFPPQAIGGATRVVADNVRDLAARYGDELEIEVFTTTEGGERPYALRSYMWEGVKVTAVTAASAGNVDSNPDDPRMGEIFARHLDHFKPDLVHFHCIQRLTAAVCRETHARGIPYYITLHDGWWISDHQFLLDENLRLTLYDYARPTAQLLTAGAESYHRMHTLETALRRAACLLPVSEAFAAIYRGCGFQNLQTIENGVSDMPTRPRTPSASGRVRLAHIGGAVVHKGVHLLKHALMTGRFENLSLTLVDHSLLPGVEIADLWGTTPVRICARIPQSEVSRLYADIDVLVAPSIWPESFGLVTREAARAGCWIIASDRGAIGTSVTPDNGFVVGVGDATALSSALAEIDANPTRYRHGTQYRGTLRSSQDQAEAYAQLYLRAEPATPDQAREPIGPLVRPTEREPHARSTGRKETV